MAKKGLGRGLSALLGESVRVDAQAVASAQGAAGAPEGPQFLAIERMVANPDQPRRRFDDAALAELADSIREKGLLQPILVRPLASDPGLYEIVAGERRWRAAQKAQLHKVPVIVRDLDETLDLNPDVDPEPASKN
ncbi:MAG: ParB/RepB/Spo0J family partition protein, partial [Alphaproteobacteria bacterium]